MRKFHRQLAPALAAVCALMFVLAPGGQLETVLAAFNTFTSNFAGTPAAPQPFKPGDWDVTVHSRDPETWNAIEATQAQHGSDCAAPPATHTVTNYDDVVFICNNHLMTAMNAGGYGVVYLTPNQMVDFSQGEAVVSWNMSTLRTSMRDWVDLWVTPFSDNLQLPLEDFLPDLNGLPRRAIHVRMQDANGSGSAFSLDTISNFQTNGVDGNWWTGFESFLTPSPTRRDLFELHVSRTHVKFGMPQYNFWWIDSDVADLGWTQGVIQFGHHSYTPQKACDYDGSCGPDTWHWSNVSFSPAIPFTILRADHRFVNATNSAPFNFPSPAPASSNLRFAAIGSNVQVSFDKGQTWQAAHVQAASAPDTSGTRFQSYWTPMPAGVRSVMLRAQDTPYMPWNIRDVSIFSLAAAEPTSTATPIANSTSTPTPKATSTPTSTTTPPPTTTTTPTVTPTTVGQTIRFNALPSGQPLTGQYPNTVIDWGSNEHWFVSGPYGQFSSNSISFNGPDLSSANFQFISPHKLISLKAYNGGSVASTISISCPGLPTKQVSMTAGLVTTISTGWPTACAGSVTISSSNGWDTNFDQLVIQ